MPRPSQSNSEVVVLGGGGGLATVLSALRKEACRVTAIVSLAYEEERDGASGRDHSPGDTVEGLRSALESLSGDELALARAIRRPLTIKRLGRHPLGNFVLASLAGGLGDHVAASVWLGEQLGIRGAVLPATTVPVRCTATRASVRFAGERSETPDAAVAAIEHARLALLAPGSLRRSLLSSSAVPDVARALERTRARVVWIANLEPDPLEPDQPEAIDHLLALRRRGVRVDAVLHDPEATLSLEPEELEREGVRSIARTLRSGENRAEHDPVQLRNAVGELLRSRATSTVAG